MDKVGGGGQGGPIPTAESHQWQGSAAGWAAPLPSHNFANFPLIQPNSCQTLQSWVGKPMAGAHWGAAAHIAAIGAEKSRTFGLSPALPSSAVENGAASGGADHTQSGTSLLKRKDTKDVEGESQGRSEWIDPTNDEQCGGAWLVGKQVRVFWDDDDRSYPFLVRASHLTMLRHLKSFISNLFALPLRIRSDYLPMTRISHIGWRLSAARVRMCAW